MGRRTARPSSSQTEGFVVSLAYPAKTLAALLHELGITWKSKEQNRELKFWMQDMKSSISVKQAVLDRIKAFS